MTVVIDASAAVKLVLDEDDSDIARRAWDEAADAVAPTIVIPEVAAAIGAARRAERIDEAGAARAHAAWKRLSTTIDVRIVDEGLAEIARGITEQGTVRGMDAIYLAVARELEDPDAGVALLSFDVRQRAAATAEGVGLMPA